MNRKQTENRDMNVKVLARNYPTVNATKLQNKLYALSLKCEQNAVNLCSLEGWEDRRDALRAELDKLADKFGIKINADVTGDPRGYCLKLHLADGSYNTWGGKESGWGIGSN